MFTLCIVIYASVVSNTPAMDKCWSGLPQEKVTELVTACEDMDKDPIRTCSARKLGPSKWVLLVHELVGSGHIVLPGLPPASAGKAVKL